MSEIQHEDKCRWWDDEEFCDCGALAVDKLERDNAALRAQNADLLAALQIVKEQRQTWWGKAVQRGGEIHKLQSALSRCRADALEEAARKADESAEEAERVGKQHPEDSSSRDRLFARARAARYIADCIRALQTTPPSTEPSMLICSHAGHKKCYKFCGHLKPHERKEDYCAKGHCRHIDEFVRCISYAKTS